MKIRPQTIEVRGGPRIIVRESSMDIVRDGVTCRLHLSPSGDVLRITWLTSDEIAVMD
jgi:hypothetical protein